MMDQVPTQPTGTDRFGDLKRRFSVASPIIVDGGAYKGEMIDLFLTQYASPVIHAFEANPARAARLGRKYAGRSNVSIHPKALGAADARIAFHILATRTLSSVLAPKNKPGNRPGPATEVVERVLVDQVRLDGILERGADILKLDLQGYELEALKGCGRLLGSTGAIACEVGLVERYEGQPLFDEVDRFLLSAGFRLLHLYDPDGWSGGTRTHLDAVYLNKRFFPGDNDGASSRKAF